MHVHKAEITTSAVEPEFYPADNLPEIALAGRSNVGKSSFINKMIQRSGLARTSSQPGKTQTLNFYTINDQFRFVDVPGYGYARVSKTQREQFSEMIEAYLETRPNLELLLLLMDARHEPTSLDHEMYQYAETLEIPFAIVLTKVDKIKSSQRNKHLSMYKNALDLPSVDALFEFSSQSGEGSQEIWDIIEDIITDQS